MFRLQFVLISYIFPYHLIATPPISSHAIPCNNEERHRAPTHDQELEKAGKEEEKKKDTHPKDKVSACFCPFGSLVSHNI